MIVFTAPEKAVVGERPRPFGPPLGWDPITSTLIFGEQDAVLVDTLTTVAEASALTDWIALHCSPEIPSWSFRTGGPDTGRTVKKIYARDSWRLELYAQAVQRR